MPLDPERLIEGLTDVEKSGVAAALPNHLIASEAERRGLVLAENAGKLATGDTLAAENAVDFKAALPRFLDEKELIPVDEQLATMKAFWQILGYQMPESASLRANISIAEAALRESGSGAFRVMPAPMLDLKSRIELVDKAHGFPKNKLRRKSTGLSLPKAESVYGKLLAGAGEVRQLEDRGKNNVITLRYRLPDGDLVNKDQYQSAIQGHPRGMADAEGNIWTFPVISLNPVVRTNNSSLSTLTSTEQIDPLVTPESMIAYQILRQAHGSPDGLENDVVNERIHLQSTIDPNDMKKIGQVFVGWSRFSREIKLSARYLGPANKQRDLNTVAAIASLG